VEKIPTGADMWLDTAWAPPWPVLLELSEKFPELEFQLDFYIEMRAEGKARIKNGETLYYDYVDLDLDPLASPPDNQERVDKL
jgi:Ferredoxin-like domain in Api92-like protein